MRKKRMGPIATLATKNTFWGKVARVAKGAVEAAGEIKRWLIDPPTYTVSPNAIDDLVGPDYVLNGWQIRPLQEGIAQGADQDQRLGNKLRVKGVKFNAKIKNTAAGPNVCRIMLVRVRHNFLLDSTPDSPLPADFLSYPRYRDVQVLYDKKYNLQAVGSEFDSRMISLYRQGIGETFFLDNTSDKPDKGTLMFCFYAESLAVTVNWTSEITYHDMV